MVILTRSGIHYKESLFRLMTWAVFQLLPDPYSNINYIHMWSQAQKKMDKRKPNFPDEEIRHLISLFRENREILLSRFSSAVTNKKKTECW